MSYRTVAQNEDEVEVSGFKHGDEVIVTVENEAYEARIEQLFDSSSHGQFCHRMSLYVVIPSRFPHTKTSMVK